ncbi:DUF1972 domain-containing protein [Algivirga pacifica]|uniref:Glycosyltransferase family 1 protein n=1 Tax=Algivirga pacifica TaxID=1162670 RepID=A0ABP9D7G3_9BACT
MRKKVSIIGSVGIPAKYGGFETLVEYLTKDKINSDIEYHVFCSSKAYSEKLPVHNNAKLHYVNFEANGVSSIIYDIISIIKASFFSDTMLILGVSGALILPILRLFYRGKIVCNIDGLEHRRDKWSPFARKMLKFFEGIAVRNSDVVVADNKGIYDYVKETYARESSVIAYGADHTSYVELQEATKTKYKIPEKYYFSVCRIEPENNTHILLEAFSQRGDDIVFVGNWDNSEYGRELKVKYSSKQNITLLDPIYDQHILNQLRSNCYCYLHGHSAGGTNPSLVEAMYLSLPIIAFDVNYNRYTTFGKAMYFKNVSDLHNVIDTLSFDKIKSCSADMQDVASSHYTWYKIAEKYEEQYALEVTVNR